MRVLAFTGHCRPSSFWPVAPAWHKIDTKGSEYGYASAFQQGCGALFAQCRRAPGGTPDSRARGAAQQKACTLKWWEFQPRHPKGFHKTQIVAAPQKSGLVSHSSEALSTGGSHDWQQVVDPTAALLRMVSGPIREPSRPLDFQGRGVHVAAQPGPCLLLPSNYLMMHSCIQGRAKHRSLVAVEAQPSCRTLKRSSMLKV